MLALLQANAQQADNLRINALRGQEAQGLAERYATVLLDEEPPAPALELTSFEASSEGSAVRVSWGGLNELNNDSYTVERSVDLLQWSSVEHVVVAQANTGYTVHEVLDEHPHNGVSYYRLIHIRGDVQEEVSDLFSVRHDALRDLLIQQSPVAGRFTVLANGPILNTQLLNNRGQFMPMDIHTEGNMAYLNAELLEPGTYYVHVVVDGKAVVRPVIIGNGQVIGG
jgi:hypothetical protein